MDDAAQPPLRPLRVAVIGAGWYGCHIASMLLSYAPPSFSQPISPDDTSTRVSETLPTSSSSPPPISTPLVETVLFEKAPDIFHGASGHNQYRIHRGYHYPRSYVTRHQISQCQQRFQDTYGSFLYPVRYNVYALSKSDSLLNWEAYKQVRL